MVITVTSKPFQLISNSGLGAGTLKITIPLYLDRCETVQPKIVVIARHFQKYEGRETLFTLSIPSNLPSRVSYLKFCARRKLGSSEIIATET